MDVDKDCILVLLDTNSNTVHEPPPWFPFPEITENSKLISHLDSYLLSKVSFKHIPNFQQPCLHPQTISPLQSINKFKRSDTIDEKTPQRGEIKQTLTHITFQEFSDYSIGPPKVVIDSQTFTVCSGNYEHTEINPKYLARKVIQGDEELQSLLERRRQLSFLHQWKRNVLYLQLWKRLEPEVFYNKSKLKEYSRQLEDIFSQSYRQTGRSWTLSESSSLEKLESDLSEMYAHLANKQRSTSVLKQKASRMSRYFFEMLAEAKECERRMYECELFIEEKIYGRRDFISKMNEKNLKIDKQAEQGDTALADRMTVTTANDCHTANPFSRKNTNQDDGNSESLDDSAAHGCDENQGVRRTMYRKMEELGELNEYSSILKELSEYIFSHSRDYSHQFPSLLSDLSWLDETDDTRPTIPPSQDNFRDGTLYTTCVYAEIRLMIILRATLTAFNDGLDNKKFATMLQQISEANNELYELKRKLDSGRRALYKKLKLHWAERNSKWNCFPPLKRGYRLLNMLGKGGFAEVWEVFDPITLTVQAAKLHILSPGMEMIERGNVVMRVKNEIDIHKSCRAHRHIVDMKACFEMGDNMLATILELCEDGDLDRYIKIHGPVPEDLAIIWTIQILEGLLYMKHLPQGRVHHCDLKPGNILFHKGIIKLADFGLSRMVPPDSANTIWTGGGTLWYQPPECLLANFQSTPPLLLTDKIDMWAVGCILYEMLFCSRPFGATSLTGNPSEQIYNESLNGVHFPTSFQQISIECKEFIEKLLAFDPNARLSIEEAMRLPIIRNRARNTNN